MTKKSKQATIYAKSIKTWPEDDRPREKLLKKGAKSLSNSELLAILLRTGTSGLSAIDLARKGMQKFGTFRNMAHTDSRDWKEFKGLGSAKIAHIQAALEIGRRFREDEANTDKQKISSAKDIVDVLMPQMRNLRELDRLGDIRLNMAELKAVINASSERDETAEICTNKKDNPEPDTQLRDTENIPLKETIEAYFDKEVKPYVPDAWIDYSKTKVGYEIPMTRHFYVYEPPRKLEDIETEIKSLEGEIVKLLGEVTK